MIHTTAIISPEAKIQGGVQVGPYAVIGPHVKIGEGSSIGAHVVIDGMTSIGPGVRIFQFASIGAPPQDIKYRGEPTRLEIGEGTIIREFVTVHRGTEGGGGITRIGENCLLMAYCHVAHDCSVGDSVIMSNGATLGGHVEVGDHVVMGGLSAIHQFCRIGAYSFIGGVSSATKDIPPFAKFWGQRGRVYGLNLVGLRRHGFSRESLNALKEAYRVIFFGKGTVKESIETAEKQWGSFKEVADLINFIKTSKRGISKAGSNDEEPC